MTTEFLILSRWECVETIGWLAVIGGCIGEGIAEFTKWPKEDRFRHNIGKASWLVLVAGLALEFLGSHKVSSIKDLTVAKLNTKASEAIERAARFEKQAEEARLETERIKSLVEWRSLLPEQKEKLKRKLSLRPSGVKIVYVANDPEAMWFAMQLAGAFKVSGWEFNLQEIAYQDTMVFGFSIVGNSEQAESVRGAFRFAQMKFGEDNVITSSGTTSRGSRAPPQPVTIFVGSKLRPMPQ